MSGKRRYVRRKANYRKPVVSKSVKKYVKRQIDVNIENKYSTSASINVAVKRAGTLLDCTNLARGHEPNQMIGERVKAMSLKLRWELEQAASVILALDDHNNVRVIVFQWMKDRLASPPILSNILNIPGGSDPTLAHYNPATRSDYRIMYDKTYILSATPVYNGSNMAYYTGGNSRAYGSRNFFGKGLPRRFITYTNGLNTGKYHIYMLIVSDSEYTPDPQVSLTAEFNYQDA